jgi:small subunit ribosomal protein S20
MPNSASAKKSLRQSERRRAENIKRKRAFRDAVKQVRTLANAGKAAEAVQLLPKAFQTLDKAAKTNIIKKNMASRVKSRLSKIIARAS